MLEKLKGSPHRDEYKFQHKQRKNYNSDDDHAKCHGFDLDFVEVRNKQIICFTDIKKFGDEVTWIENVCYPFLEKIAPVLIIETDDKFTRFEIRLFHGSKKLKFPGKSFFGGRTYWNEFLPNIEYYLTQL